MSQLVTIFGGSGFVGRYIARRMAAKGWRVRVAVRRPNEALFVKPYGAVGQCEPVFANIRDDASVAAALAGADAVVNCVGTFDVKGRNDMDAVHVEGAARIARLAAAAGVDTMVHLSAIGANPESDATYGKTKAEGEAAVLSHMPGAMILRPSVMFGPEDEFFNRFAGMARMAPVLPLFGGETRFQPVYVDDVAAAVEVGLTGAPGGIYELGGPDADTLRGWMQRMLGTISRTRVIVNMPFWVGNLLAWELDLAQSVTFGLFRNSVLTRDQVRMLRVDNVVSEGAKGFDDLGIDTTAAEVIMPEYLWRFRPSGQYDAIKASAKNLKA